MHKWLINIFKYNQIFKWIDKETLWKKKPRSIVHREYLELSFLTCGKNHTEKKFLSEKQSFYLTFTEKYPTKGILVNIDHR